MRGLRVVYESMRGNEGRDDPGVHFREETGEGGEGKKEEPHRPTFRPRFIIIDAFRLDLRAQFCADIRASLSPAKHLFNSELIFLVLPRPFARSLPPRAA